MRVWLRGKAAAGLALLLGGCASPHFVHSPEFGLYFSPSQIPPLLKSLRCELATFAAATNQRQIIATQLMAEEYRELAYSKYPFFALDPARFGGVALDLKIQDSAAISSGTSFDWKRTADAAHARTWRLGPTLGDQSTYQAITSFVAPQDVYRFNPERVTTVPVEEAPTEGDKSAEPFSCYRYIPLRTEKGFRFKAPDYVLVPGSFGKVHVDYSKGFPVALDIRDLSQDIEALAKNTYPGYATFDRISVNGDKPLAQWLLEVSSRASTTTMLGSPDDQEQVIDAGQITLTFAIQTTVGLNVRTGFTTTLWTAIAGEATAGVQHTGTMTLVLNGVDAAASAGTKTGSSVRYSDTSKPATSLKVSYTPMPTIAKNTKKANMNTFGPAVAARPRRAFVPQGISKGSLIYPLVPLGPLGQ